MSTCEYTFDSVVRIVIVSIVITLLLVGFFASVVWLYLVKRNAHKFDISYDPRSAELNIIKSNQLNNAQSRFAFDNPYFKDDDEFIVTNNDKLNFNNYNNELSDATILSNGAALQNDFNQTGQNSIVNNFIKNNKVSSKQTVAKKAWEDYDLYKQPEKISVDLIGRDFCGLGFNVIGDMRNGIFVRDVLKIGPAMESNKIKPGDKLSSITISMKNMVYEDALTILSYASPYNVKINLERDNQPQNKKSNKKSTKFNNNRTLQNTNERIHHPLYKTRSVDNLIEIGKYDKLNYGTSSNHHINYRLENSQSNRNDFNSRNGYSRIITKLKQQIVTFINPNNNLENLNQQQSSSNMKNLFKSNKNNWPEEYSGNDNLNAVVVGNNLAFKDDDEDDNFRKEYQLSQLRYQNSLNQHHQQYNNNSIDQQFNSLQYNMQNQEPANSNSLSNKQSNLVKYHQQTMTDLSQVDNMQSMNQFVSVNLNDFNQSYHNRHDEMDYNTRKGNSTQLNDLKDLSLTSSSPNSLPLDDNETNKRAQQIDRQQVNSNFTTTAQIHQTAIDQSINQINELKEINDNNESDEFFKIKNAKDKPRSSSMNDLPNEYDITLNPNIINDDSMKLKNQAQSTLERSLERAISLDLSNQTDQNETNSKLSETVFTNRLFTKEDQSKTKRLIKMKNQSNLVQSIKSQSSSLGDLSYEQKYILNNNNNDKLSQSSLNNSLTTTNLTGSLSNSKLSNQSRSIRNSLSTNSTCSSPSSLPSTSELEYKDDESLAYMLKSSPEESQSILINNKQENNNLDNEDDELDARDSILVVNDQHKSNDKEQSIDLFTNKEQAKKIINDVFTMSSIRSLHSNTIKSDQQLQNELLQLNKQIDNDKSIDQSIDKNKQSSNISNFKISSIKKEIPVKSNLINNHTLDHQLNNNKSINQIDNQSKNKENELKLKINYNQLSDNLSSHLAQDDELKELRNKVSRLKKEFSLRSKLIENQNKQNNVNKFRKYSDGQVNPTKASTNPFLKSKDKQHTNDASSISKKQEQIINSNALDFESFVFESKE